MIEVSRRVPYGVHNICEIQKVSSIELLEAKGSCIPDRLIHNNDLATNQIIVGVNHRRDPPIAGHEHSFSYWMLIDAGHKDFGSWFRKLINGSNERPQTLQKIDWRGRHFPRIARVPVPERHNVLVVVVTSSKVCNFVPILQFRPLIGEVNLSYTNICTPVR